MMMINTKEATTTGIRITYLLLLVDIRVHPPLVELEYPSEQEAQT